MNSRERFLATIRGEQTDHPPLFPEGIREGVLQVWYSQGLPPGVDLEELFFYDQFEEVDADVYPSPEITDWSDPLVVLPLLRQRLDPEDPHRLPADWSERVKRWKDRQHPVFLRIHQGLLLSLGIGDWQSFAPAMLLLVDRPAYVHQIMELQSDFAVRFAERILCQVDLDGVIFSEPIADNQGALISPKMYREFALQSYTNILTVLCDYKVPAVIWRSYADPSRLLPEVLRYPFNAFWLCEAPYDNSKYAHLRLLAGPDITLIGGIDTDDLRRDSQASRQAIAAIRPLVDAGHFIPLADGRVREDFPFQRYADYRLELQKVFVKAKINSQ